MGGGRKKKVTVGWRYGLTVHMGACTAPVDCVEKVLADDRDAYTTAITSSQSVSINNPELFGGDKKEGGLVGQLQIQMGESTQTPSSLLTPHLGANIPAFRGVLGFIYRGIMSANNPYLKAFSFVVRRILQGWQDDNVWYPEKAVISHIASTRTQNDINPAHIVYQCLTNTDWGLGYPVSSIDDDNFRAAADALYTEGFGLSLGWHQQSTLKAFLAIIFNHIAGSLNVDPRTGKYQIRLIRKDYDVNDLPVFNDHNINELASFQRAGWGELVNEVTVKFTDADKFEETAVTLQNIATIQAQGSIVNQTLDFTGITNATLAARVAQRELIARSAPLAKIQLKINRNAWQSMPNGVFKFTWPKLGIVALVMRVVSVETGTLENGVITIDAIEDVFGLPSNAYTGQQDNEWQDPLQAPAPSPNRLLSEVTYYDLATTLAPADLSYIDPDDGYPMMFAARPSVATYDYKLLIDDAEVDQGAHCAVGTTLTTLAKEEFSTFEIGVDDSSQVTIGEYAVIGSEYVRIDAYDALTGELTVARGVIDTVPVEHPINSFIFFGDGASTSDPTASPIGAVLDAKVITRTGLGELDASSAPVDSVTIQARHNKPYPPGKFRINGDYMPVSVTDDVLIEWVERNRITQDSNLLAQDEASITPEAGTTYTLKIYDQTDTLVRTLTGLTGTSYTYTVIDELADCGAEQTHLRIELLAERDGVQSWQSHTHRFERVYTP